ncbi:hypothetical protein, unlikely [Trypanosoma congolense IL3000]|uniref:Uncharacterized protein n=1 Tax=Trypanosoma congolense (strain IL3000) TaxID=1068625 RepID=F9WJV3_TRYCI|nr:hypothetical protein, unlikely [Trypanosoma congolense IL3000]
MGGPVEQFKFRCGYKYVFTGMFVCCVCVYSLVLVLFCLFFKCIHLNCFFFFFFSSSSPTSFTIFSFWFFLYLFCVFAFPSLFSLFACVRVRVRPSLKSSKEAKTFIFCFFCLICYFIKNEGGGAARRRGRGGGSKQLAIYHIITSCMS